MGVGQNGHKPADQLRQEIEEASKKVTLGATYVHYKGAHKRYRVLHFSTLEATDELCVVYEALYEPGALSFVRPLKSWLEEVEWEGKTVARFKQES